jgi:hypothetical protein
MSWSGQCQGCAMRALTENITGISRHSGPAFQRWRRAMAASVGGVLLDERADEG